MMDAGVIEGNSPLYPTSLERIFGALALPRLSFRGNLQLLGRPAVGFCGSRHASDRGLEVAAELARELASRDVVVVSGYARGVDTKAHVAALVAGGATIISLPEGMDRFRIKRELKGVWDWSRVLVISQYANNAVWRADRAMERNKIIVGVSRATIVIEAGETGGTLDAGMTALKHQIPLFVAKYFDEKGTNAGNRILLAAGGMPLGRDRSHLGPNVEPIIAAIAD
jgi:DNA processing protein